MIAPIRAEVAMHREAMISVPERALRLVVEANDSRALGREEARAVEELRAALESLPSGRCPGCRSCRARECPYGCQGGV